MDEEKDEENLAMFRVVTELLDELEDFVGVEAFYGNLGKMSER
jgi:hypothetical protein